MSCSTCSRLIACVDRAEWQPTAYTEGAAAQKLAAEGPVVHSKLRLAVTQRHAGSVVDAGPTMLSQAQQLETKNV